MGIGDKLLSRSIVPFRANWVDGTGAIGNVFEPGGLVTGDASVIKTGNGVGGMIRMLRPSKGNVREARMTMNAVTPFGSSAGIRFYGATFAADGITPVAPTAAQIAADHKLLTGYSSALSYGSQDNVFIDGLNMMPIIASRGDADFNEDMWILGIELDLTKGSPSDWTLWDFKVDCSAELGLL